MAVTPYYRKCIQITAMDSPNVQAGLRGDKDHKPVPGVLTYEEYLHRRKTWDPIRQTVGLDAKFYKGAEIKLVPEAWIKAAAAYGQLPWDGREGRRPPPTPPLYLGVDCAEGGDDTSWVLIDRHGVLKIISIKTADTNVIYGITMDFLRDTKMVVLPENVIFDRGGGGKQCADRIRANGGAYAKVRTVGFGTIKHEPKRGLRLFPEKKGIVEDQGEAKDRRSEMYWDIHVLLEVALETHDDPVIVDAINLAMKQTPPPPLLVGRSRFAMPMHGDPPMCRELARQLECVPLRYDQHGKFWLIPKQTDKKDPMEEEDKNTFRYLIGRSPDIADALGCAVHGMLHKPAQMTAGVK